MNVPLLVAGSLSLLAAAVHGAGGEALVVRRLSPESLPPTRLGGPGMTRLMIRATWHMTTVGFLTVGSALVVAGTAIDGDTAQGIGLVAATAATGFAAIAVAAGLAHVRRKGIRAMFDHLAPVLLTAVAVLAWVGIA